MKKILCLTLLIFCSLVAFGQVTKTAEKPKATSPTPKNDDLLPNKLTTKEKPNPANDKIKRLDDGDDLLPAKPGTKEKPNPANDKIKRLDDGDDLLLIDVKKGGNEPKESDLLDISVKSQSPAKANAGSGMYDKIPLNGNFTFNKKISFKINSAEGNMSSYFYFNTKNGYSMLDDKANEQLVGKQEGTMTQIKTPQTNFYGYSKTAEGNFAFEMGDNDNGSAHQNLISELNSERLFKTFKKQANVVPKGTNGVPFARVGYTGKDDEGKTVTIWLSDAQDVKLDIGYTFDLIGHWGLGYVASPTGRTYLITGFEGDGMGIFLTGIQQASVQFSGAGYKTMGEVIKTSMDENAAEEAENPMEDPSIDEEDAALRALMKQGYELQKKAEARVSKALEKATASNNISAIADISRPTVESLDEQNALNQINLKIEYRQIQIRLENAFTPKERSDISKAMSCNTKAQSHWNQYNDRAKEIVRNNPKLDTYDLQEKIGELMTTYLQQSLQMCP
jgi:inhibitor of KinA sporulation pathway (predicted exonuclease)